VGKSDPIDAEHTAKEVLAGRALAIPKLAEGAVETIRLVKIARDGAVRAQSQAMITLKAVLVTAPDELRAELGAVTACAALVGNYRSGSDAAIRYVLGALARRWGALHQEIKTHAQALKELTGAVAPNLLAAFGIGPDVAAELLVMAGGNADRIRSEAAFAKLCGACPIPASSGMTKRHRLNRGGNRQANAALYPGGGGAHALAHAHHGLRAAAHRGRSHQAPSHPLPQALPRARGLPTPSNRPHHRPGRLCRRVEGLDIYRSINAVVESLWRRMQVELLDRKRWSTRLELASAIFEYLEIFHDRQRRHSSLSMLTPGGVRGSPSTNNGSVIPRRRLHRSQDTPEPLGTRGGSADNSVTTIPA
jgi:hypothetical protein